MKYYFNKLTCFIVILISFMIASFPAFAFTEKIDGVEYLVRKIDAPPLSKEIVKKYDLYEIYFENRTDSTFTIPGYSVDLGVDYSTAQEIQSKGKNKGSRKFALIGLGIAGASTFGVSGIAGSAAKTALRSSNFIRQKNGVSVDDNSILLAPSKTYVLYPRESLSIFFFVDRHLGQEPSVLKFICHNEDLNVNQVLINKKLELRVLDAENTPKDSANVEGKVIAAPEGTQYK